jgi:hypothetical protein
MKCGGHIPDRDSLFRHSIHPLAFRGVRFAQEKLLKLYDQEDGSLLASLTWGRYVPTTKLIHDSGCRLALHMNEKDRAAGKFKEKNRRIYCGAYELKGVAIRALAASEGLNEILSADVIHHVEEGEIAHTDLTITLNAARVANIEGTKTAIVDRLWQNCSGPLRHICDCDKGIAEADHPSSSLTAAPAGDYSDTRSFCLRVWCIVRFQICNWLWRNNFWHP